MNHAVTMRAGRLLLPTAAAWCVAGPGARQNCGRSVRMAGGTPALKNAFADLGLRPELCSAVQRLGHETPTQIQADSFQPIRQGGTDVVIAGETGIGKTLAYLLPIIDALLDGDGYAQALVLTPNADLALQVHAVVAELLKGTGLDCACLAGGQIPPVGADAANIITGTVPKVLKVADVARVRYAVLDEADALLAGSFKPAARQKYPVEKLLLALRRERAQRLQGAGGEALPPLPLQHVIVGATVPAYGTRSVRVHLDKLFPAATWVSSAGLHQKKRELDVSFVEVRDAPGGKDGSSPEERDGLAHPPQRERALVDAIEGADNDSGGTLVFANTPALVDRAVEAIRAAGLSAEPFHKLISVDGRQTLLASFAEGHIDCLVCTGLAARGLDMPRVRHVVEYTFASNVVEHLHRVGRTARATMTGRATCLYGPGDADLVEAIRAGMATGEGIEPAVSRNRSFRKRVKRAKAPR